jgi:hypothetical protein
VVKARRLERSAKVGIGQLIDIEYDQGIDAAGGRVSEEVCFLLALPAKAHRRAGPDEELSRSGSRS